MASQSNREIEKNVVMCRELWYITDMGKTIEPKAALPLLFFCGGFKQPSGRKKGGRYNVCYISGFDPDWNTHCCPCKFDFSNSQGKKEIAATTANSDGLPRMR